MFSAPSFGHAVADPEINGMTNRELFDLLELMQGLDIVGADIACFCPHLDSPNQTTALLCSELMLHFVSHIAHYRKTAKPLAAAVR